MRIRLSELLLQDVKEAGPRLWMRIWNVVDLLTGSGSFAMEVASPVVRAQNFCDLYQPMRRIRSQIRLEIRLRGFKLFGIRRMLPSGCGQSAHEVRQYEPFEILAVYRIVEERGATNRMLIRINARSLF